MISGQGRLPHHPVRMTYGGRRRQWQGRPGWRRIPSPGLQGTATSVPAGMATAMLAGVRPIQGVNACVAARSPMALPRNPADDHYGEPARQETRPIRNREARLTEPQLT
jgi:hypothetical protein